MQGSARGILTDAPGVDPSGAWGRPAENAVHAAYGIVGGFLREPGQLPATGATIVVLPMPIAGSTSAPARVLAYAPRP